MENLFSEDCIRTYSGQYVNVFNPDPATLLIEDIAWALSNQCRFGGHLPKFYSVAQHSVACAKLLAYDPLVSLSALMHDASEAYLIDIPRPIKSKLSNYGSIEYNLMQVLADKFKFTFPLESAIKDVDNYMLKIEWDSIMLNGNPNYDCWSIGHSYNNFIHQFNELYIKLNEVLV